MNLTAISHVWNEGDLITLWLSHHGDLFDKIIIIDHGSTDNTLEDIWLAQTLSFFSAEIIVVPSRLSEFHAASNDLEVMEVEKKFYLGDQATFVLNTTEFIWAIDFRERIEAHFSRTGPNRALGVGSIIMVDKEPSETVDYPFWKERTHGFVDTYPGVRRKRYFHNAPCGEYGLGRHHTNVPAEDIDDIHLLYLAFSPWPLVKNRKLAIQSRIPQADKDIGAGKEHILTPESLEQRYQDYLGQSYNLLARHEFAGPYFRNLELLESQEDLD